MTLINKDNIGLRIQQLIILVLHLILLKWIHYALTETGQGTIEEVMYHFFGMAIYGAALIRGCAWWGKRQFIKEGGNVRP